jgi:hypothetical protein
LNVPSLAVLLKDAQMSIFLMDSVLNKSAIEVCGKYPTFIKYDGSVVKALLCNAQNSIEAERVLIAACSSEQIAATVASFGMLWLPARLPTLSETVRLVRAVIRFPPLSSQMIDFPQFPEFLANLASSGDPSLIGEIASIIKTTPVSPQFVKNCASSRFLGQYYRAAVGQSDSSILSGAIAVTEVLARIGFVNDYLLLLPTLKHLLGIPAWRGFAVSLLATLSTHQEARPSLASSHVSELVSELSSDSRLAPYAKCFLSYIPVENKP